jgi:signal transduction histidine kinase
VLYLLGIVAVGVLWGMVSATAVGVLSVLTFGWFFVPPRHKFDLTEAGNWYVLFVFVIIAIVVSELAGRAQRTAQASARLAEEQDALRRVAALVAHDTSREQLEALICEQVGRLLSADVALMQHFEDDGGVRRMAHWTRSTRLLNGDWAPAVARVTELIAQTDQPAEAEHNSSNAPENGRSAVFAAVGAPITVEGRTWGAMIVVSRTRRLPANTSGRLADFTALVAIAIANAKNRAELAASEVRVVTAADQMRRRIERDLHDGAQQQLVSLAIDLQAVQEGLSRVGGGLVSTLEEFREIARGIHPAILVQGGLEPALKTLARRSPVPVELELELRRRLVEPVEVATYYVVAEALTNVAKHAEASFVRVAGKVRDGILRVRIQDDGRGGASSAHGSGLVGITDRVEALGGTLEVRSPSGSGTSVELSLPV